MKYEIVGTKKFNRKLKPLGKVPVLQMASLPLLTQYLVLTFQS